MNENLPRVRAYRIEVLDIFGATTSSENGNDSRKINIPALRDRKRKVAHGLSAIRVGNFHLEEHERRRVHRRHTDPDF